MNDQVSSQQSGRYPRSFQVVIKPVGSACNLECRYCYYLHKERLLAGQDAGDESPAMIQQASAGVVQAGTREPAASQRQAPAPSGQASQRVAEVAGRAFPQAGRISQELLDEFIRQYISSQEVDEVVFNWHGGEPALLGLEFFRKAVELEHRYAAGKRIRNDFQTNGVLLDDAWCDFFKEHDFYVGLSIDGPRYLHDCYRVVRGGGPTFDAVCRVVRLLQKHRVAFTTLTVVHRLNAREPEAVWRFLTEKLGCTRVQWLPCVEPKDFRRVAPGYWPAERTPVVGTSAARPGNSDSVVTEWSVDPDDWGEFLCRTFELWLKTGLGRVLVNWFETLVGVWMNEPARLCTLAPVCGRSLVTLEKDGTLYSCDRFVYPEYRLGRLGEPGFRLGDVVYSARQREFGEAKHRRLTEHCRRCGYLFTCYGECPKNRFVRSPEGQPGHNYLCPGLRRFFAYADPHLRDLAGRVLRKRAERLPGTSVEIAY